ncbi:MAG: ABC transporter permease [Nanoarchaeota archaeon]|nr:ABC transporter permease [Nanoarchaeota archaeon]MBU0962433.1 ABC transporter permease [Nanoarchaeota archaeon]
MTNIWNIILKNFRLLIRSKTSSLVVILGPLLLIFLVGMAFNTTSLYDLRLGVYTPSYSELTNSLVDNLKGNFLVTELDKQDQCINGVKTGEFNVCAVIPADLQVTTKENIIFYVDYSRVNLVYNIISVISSQLQNESTKLSTELTSDLLTRLNDAKVSLVEKKSDINSINSNNNQAITNINAAQKNLVDLELQANYQVDENATSSEKNMAEKLEDAADAINRSLNLFSSTNNLLDQNKDAVSSVSGAVDSVISTVSGLSVSEATDIVSPIKTQIEPITIKEEHINYLFPTLLILMIMFISILLSSTLLINEKSTFAYFRNFITPTSSFTFLIGNFLTNWFIAIFEVIIIIGFSAIFLFKDNFLTTGLLSVLVLAVGAVVFILLGMVIGYTFRSGETANLAAISIASVMLFFSNTILPIETLPTYIKSIVVFNPFVVIESMLKKLILYNAGLADQGWNFLILFGYIMLLGLIAYIMNESTKRRL